MSQPSEDRQDHWTDEDAGGVPDNSLTLPPPPHLRRRYFWGVDTASDRYSLHRLRALWGRHKKLISAVFLAVWGATIAGTLLTPRKYEAELKLFLRRERLEPPVTADRGVPRPLIEVSESEVSSEIELFRSRSLLEKTIQICHLLPNEGFDAADRPKLLTQAVLDLEKDLRVSPIRKTSLISVKYAARDPVLAAEVLNTAAALYLEQHSAVHRNQETSGFFTHQAEYYKQALGEAQRVLSAFQQRREISLLEQQKQANLSRVTALEASFQETESQIRDAEQRAALLRRQLESLPVTIQAQSRTARNEALMERLKSLLVELENKRTELLTKYDPGYRLVQEVEKQIRDTRTTLEREQAATVVDQTETPNPIRQSVEGELLRTESLIAGLWARRTSVAKDLMYYKDNQQTLERLTAEHNDLQRRVKVAEENYLLYQKKQEESRIADAMDQQKILNVSVLERAVPPALPVERHQLLILLLGLVVAAFAGAGCALMAEHFNPSIWGATELITYTGLPVLATIPKGKAVCSYSTLE